MAYAYDSSTAGQYHFILQTNRVWILVYCYKAMVCASNDARALWFMRLYRTHYLLQRHGRDPFFSLLHRSTSEPPLILYEINERRYRIWNGQALSWQQVSIPIYGEGVYMRIKKATNNLWVGGHLLRNWSRITIRTTFAKHKYDHCKQQLYRLGGDRCCCVAYRQQDHAFNRRVWIKIQQKKTNKNWTGNTGITLVLVFDHESLCAATRRRIMRSYTPSSC